MTLTPNIAWFDKYQPKNIEDFIFENEDYQVIINKWWEEEKLDGNLLLSGPPGTGKTTLAKLLINRIIKASNDLYKMKTRSVEEIDEIISWVKKKPVRSKIKIVYIEEMDKISKQAMSTLKDGYLENYIAHTTFIGCTNYPKKIDSALITRFNYKFALHGNNVNNIATRLEKILTIEEAIYNKDELLPFVEKNYKKGIRELLNSLQASYVSHNKRIDFIKSQEDLDIELNVVNLFIDVLHIMSNTKKIERHKCFTMPTQSPIVDSYNNLLTILHNNQDINFDTVFSNLYEKINFLPCQVIIAKYNEEIDYKKFPHLHVISCLYECMRTFTDMTG